MFDLREFLKKGLLDAVGKKPTYWVVLNSAGWYEKGVLVETDLAEINEAMMAKEEEEKSMLEGMEFEQSEANL